MFVYLAGENGKWRLVKKYADIPCRQPPTETNGAVNRVPEQCTYILQESTQSRTAQQRCTHTHTHTQAPLLLESYYYARKNTVIKKLLPYLGGILLDSGAYTFMQGAETVDWDKYVDAYADWIIEHGVELFFELDIDSVVGLKEVERLRKRLEARAGRQSIPVWHISRGKDYYLAMCRDYKYVAFGGLQTDGVPRNKIEKAFPWFIDTAHKYGAKIHGLGYTNIEGLHRYHFDSVDSTAWLYGNRGGYLYKFNPRNGTMDKQDVPPGHRLKAQAAAEWNFNEWLKFQQYAMKHL